MIDNLALDIDTPMLLRAASANGFIRTNAAFRERVGFSEQELSGKPLLEWIDPGDKARARSALAGGDSCLVGHRTRSGEPLVLKIRVTDESDDTVVLGRCVSDAADPIEREQDDTTVLSTLDTIARIVEEQNAGYKCSILLVEDGKFVRGAGPSLPEDYNAAVDGYAIGPKVGSCGTAIYWNVPVIVEDIQKDPLWADLAALAKGAGVAACWSHPFTTKSGQVLGALALYATEPSAPTAEQLRTLRAAARMTGLAVERGRAEEALRQKRKREIELEQQLEHAAKMEALEQQLQQAAKMDALGLLAGGVAHDFNNLLTSIISFAGFVHDELPLGDERRNDIQQVLAAADRGTGLTRQLLLFARQRPAVSQQLDIGSSFTAIERLLRRTIGENIRLTVTTPADPIYIWSDATQFDQLLINLSVNAKDAMPDGGALDITATALDVVDSSRDLTPGKYIHLRVQDNGVGMTAATKSRIFEPFFSTKGPTKGTGLGLATCYGVVKQLGGSIEVESTLGEGTTFHIYLPRFMGNSKDVPPRRIARNSLGGTETILVIEDEPSIRHLAERALTRGGYKVLTAEDGVAGLELFRENEHAVDLVFSDIVLPRSSGFEVAHEVRRIRPNVGMLLTTGYPDLDNTDKETAEFPIFWKPYRPADLLRRVRACLDERDDTVEPGLAP